MINKFIMFLLTYKVEYSQTIPTCEHELTSLQKPIKLCEKEEGKLVDERENKY